MCACDDEVAAELIKLKQQGLERLLRVRAGVSFSERALLELSAIIFSEA